MMRRSGKKLFVATNSLVGPRLGGAALRSFGRMKPEWQASRTRGKKQGHMRIEDGVLRMSPQAPLPHAALCCGPAPLPA